MKTKTQPKPYDLVRLIILSITTALLLTILATGCNEECGTETYTSYEPVFAPLNQVRVEAQFSIEPQEVNIPGKLYFIDDHIFISELDEGIHVFNNSDPKNPENVGFIDLPGTKDLAGKDGFLYADNYMDLVILDISNKTDIKEVNRIEDVFQSYYYYDPSTNEIFIGYEEALVEYDLECPDAFYECLLCPDYDDDVIADVALESSSGTGTGGSMARFTIDDNFLYAINDWQMQLFDITTVDSPIPGNQIDLGGGIETIFPYQDKLFIGSRAGMHIYDNSTPSNPQYVSSYEHATACDPVVVQDTIAYVTLRSGTQCETFTNQLDVINIADIYEPTLIATYEMNNPHGLGINGDCLFITEGDYGLKLFNATDPMTIDQNLIKHHQDINAFDVIPLDDVLLMIGEDGLYQYEYDCQDKLELLSVIQY